MRMRIARPVLLNHVFSPYGISILSTCVFLLAWFFPPKLYSSLMYEPDLMFLDPATLLLFLLSVAGFWIGLLLIDFLFPAPALLDSVQPPVKLRNLSLLFPLILTTLATVFVGLQVYRNSPNIVILLLSQQGDAAKEQILNSEAIVGALGWASIMQISVLWWTYWMLSRSRPSGPRRFRERRFFSWFVLSIGLLVQIALCTIRVSRADLMPVLGGFGVLYMILKLQDGKLKTGDLFRYLIYLLGSVMLLFSLFAILRGATDISGALGSLMGYTLASYNRLTAIISGKMHYPYGGHGVYLSDFLAYNKSFNDIIPLKEIMGWPNYLELWNADFLAPERAGLRYDLIWSGTFGYLFSDFGWATPLVLICYGIIYGTVWRLARAGSTLGIALYPWFAFNALCWFSSNVVFDFKVVFFTAAGLLLTAYQKLLSVKIPGNPLVGIRYGETSQPFPFPHSSGQAVPRSK